MLKKLSISTMVLSVFLFSSVTFGKVINQFTFERGVKAYQSEEFEEALEIFKHLYEENPNSSLVSFYLGLCYKQIGEYDKAKSYLIQAASLKPFVKDAYVELGYILYNEGSFKEALKWIEKAEKFNLSSARLFFLKGLICLKKGRYKRARTCFLKARRLNPSFKYSSTLQVCISYLMEGRPLKALECLKKLLSENPPKSVAALVKKYIEDIEKWRKGYRAWQGLVSIGYEFDDNVVSKPSSDIGLTAVDDIGRKSDSCVLAGGLLSYQPLLRSPFFLRMEGSFNSRSYFHRIEYSVIGTVLRVTPGYIFSKKGSFTFNTEYTRIWLDKAPYLWQISISPTLTLKTVQNHIFQISPGYVFRDMLRYVQGAAEEEDRDGKQVNLLIGYTYLFFNKKGSLNVKARLFRDRTQGENWDSHGHQLSVGLLFPLKYNINLSLSEEVTVRKFENINSFSGQNVPGFPNYPARRKDNIYTTSAGLSYRINNHLIGYINYFYIRNDSNFKIYDYKRNIVSVSFNYTF